MTDLQSYQWLKKIIINLLFFKKRLLFMVSSKNNNNLRENESIVSYIVLLVTMLFIHVPGLFPFLNRILMIIILFILGDPFDHISYYWNKNPKIDCMMKLFTRTFIENDLHILFISFIIIMSCLLIYDLTKQTTKSFKTSEEIRNILVKIK
jgi:hypothetical protein